MIVANPNLRRRNLLTVLILFCLVPTVIPVMQQENIGWIMWRDAPLLAAAFTAVAALLVVAWRRS